MKVKNERRFYIYLYLDSRKPGAFKYGPYEFDYEPFYVGKGFGRRITSHLTEAKNNFIEGNQLKLNVIRKIWGLGLEPIIVKYKENLTEDEAFDQYEIPMIAAIGRRDKKTGPLTNLTDGGEGSSGVIVSEETLKKLREASKRENRSPESLERSSIATKKHWEDPVYRKTITDSIYNLWKDPSYRKKHAEAVEKSWEDPDRKERHSRGQKIRFSRPEEKNRCSEHAKSLWEDPDIRKIFIESSKKENLSEETLEKMRVSSLKENLSEETRRKMREAKIGKIPTKETRKKLSDRQLGGKSHNAKPVFIDNEYFACMRDASLSKGVSRQAINYRIKHNWNKYRYATIEETIKFGNNDDWIIRERE